MDFISEYYWVLPVAEYIVEKTAPWIGAAFVIIAVAESFWEAYGKTVWNKIVWRLKYGKDEWK